MKSRRTKILNRLPKTLEEWLAGGWPKAELAERLLELRGTKPLMTGEDEAELVNWLLEVELVLLGSECDDSFASNFTPGLPPCVRRTKTAICLRLSPQPCN